MLPPYSIDILPVDGGSVASGASSPVSAADRDKLRDETLAAVVAYCGTRGDDGCRELTILECRPSGLFYTKGGILQWHQSYLPWRFLVFGPWHVPDRIKGLYGIGITAPATATLDEDAKLTDEDCSTAGSGFPTTSTGWVMAGLQVGSKVDGTVYAPIVDALCIWGSSRGSTLSIYGSDDNASWTLIEKSALSGSGYSGGIATVAAGTPYGGAGTLILFASAQQYCYYAVAYNNSAGAVFNLAEIAALSKYGDLSVTQDFANWRGMSIDNTPAVTVAGGVVSPASVSRHRYLFPENWPIVSMRFKWRGMVLRAADLTTAKNDSAGLVRLEMYNDPLLVDFADAAGLITRLDQAAVPSGTSTVIEFQIKNSHTLSTRALQLHMPVDPVAVTDEPLQANTTTQYLPHAAVNLTQCGYILNADHTGLGSLGDSSFVLDPIRCPGWTEVAGTPAAPGEYAIDYTAGTLTTFLNAALPIGTVGSWAYAALGTQMCKWSEDGATWKGFGETLTFTNGVLAPGETRTAFAYVDMTGRTERRAMPVLAVVTADY